MTVAEQHRDFTGPIMPDLKRLVGRWSRRTRDREGPPKTGRALSMSDPAARGDAGAIRVQTPARRDSQPSATVKGGCNRGTILD